MVRGKTMCCPYCPELCTKCSVINISVDRKLSNLFLYLPDTSASIERALLRNREY